MKIYKSIDLLYTDFISCNQNVEQEFIHHIDDKTRFVVALKDDITYRLEKKKWWGKWSIVKFVVRDGASVYIEEKEFIYVKELLLSMFKIFGTDNKNCFLTVVKNYKGKTIYSLSSTY